MSNSVLFLLLAFGLSVVGATAVWLHGHPRKSHRRGPDFNATLRALSETRESAAPTSGVRPIDGTAPARSPRDPRSSREHPTGS